MQTVVEVEGCDGSWWTIAGPNAGAEGIHLAKGDDTQGNSGNDGIKDLFYDPPVKVCYEEPGNWPGSRFLSYRVLRRDIVFGVEILNDAKQGYYQSWISRDSAWRKAWSFQNITKIHVTTDSGPRTLRSRLGAAPYVSMARDPMQKSMNCTVMQCVAGDPFWYEPPVACPVTTRQDTTGGGVEGLSIVVDPSTVPNGLNPTDQYIWPKWTIPSPTVAQQIYWNIPDYAFEDPSQATRTLSMPYLTPGEDCLIDTDPRVEQVSSANGTPLWARMNGVRFRYPIPPYTPSMTFQLSVSGCAPGQMATLWLPRPWSRPWGLD